MAERQPLTSEQRKEIAKRRREKAAAAALEPELAAIDENPVPEQKIGGTKPPKRKTGPSISSEAATQAAVHASDTLVREGVLEPDRPDGRERHDSRAVPVSLPWLAPRASGASLGCGGPSEPR